MEKYIKEIASASAYFAILSAVKYEPISTEEILSTVFEFVGIVPGEDKILDAFVVSICAGCVSAIAESASEVESHIEEVITEAIEIRSNT